MITIPDFFFMLALLIGVSSGTAIALFLGRKPTAALEPRPENLSYADGFKDGVEHATRSIFTEPAAVVNAYAAGMRDGRADRRRCKPKLEYK